MRKVELTVWDGNENEEFTGCEDCKYCADSIEICQLRLCVHAFNVLYDRFKKDRERENDGEEN